jgi:hypothetical protein
VIEVQGPGVRAQEKKDERAKDKGERDGLGIEQSMKKTCPHLFFAFVNQFFRL